MTATAGRGYVGIQALRGLAAMLVVLYHATQMVHERFGSGQVWTFGAAGVDLFFPISGFVMAVTTYRYWGEAGYAANFLMRRLLRIVPLYWAATLLKIAGLVLLPALASHPKMDAWHVTASFLFIPAWDAHHQAQPVVPVGWSLHFEMLFYLLFTAALLMRLRPVLWVGAVLAVFSFLPLEPVLGAVGTLANPMLLEFVAGMFIGWAAVCGRTLPKALAPWYLAAALLALPLTQLVPSGEAYASRYLLWGLPGALAVAAVISMEPLMRAWFSGWPLLLGDASYSIYLVHGFVLPPLGLAMTRLQWTQGIWPFVAVLVGCGVSALVGVGLHLWVERPLTNHLIARLLQSRQPHVGAAPADVTSGPVRP